MRIEPHCVILQIGRRCCRSSSARTRRCRSSTLWNTLGPCTTARRCWRPCPMASRSWWVPIAQLSLQLSLQGGRPQVVAALQRTLHDSASAQYAGRSDQNHVHWQAPHDVADANAIDVSAPAQVVLPTGGSQSSNSCSRHAAEHQEWTDCGLTESGFPDILESDAYLAHRAA